MAVASALPLALAVLEVDAREDAAVEAEGMALVNDEVVEVRLQPARRPALLDGPSGRSVRDRDAAHADRRPSCPPPLIRTSPSAVSAGCTMLTPPSHACSQSSLPSAGATLVAPAAAQQQDLRDSVDRHQLWRAVAAAAGRAEPARIAGGDVVGGEPAGGGDDDDVVDHQRRAREAPARNLRAGVGRRVARPHDGAVAGVERVQDSGRAERVDATVAEGRRPARTGAAIRLPEPGRVAVPPHRLAGGQVVAGDDLVVTALLLRVEEVAADREGRPARSDRPAPQLDRRRLRPIGLDPHAANDAVASPRTDTPASNTARPFFCFSMLPTQPRART